ncbi:hypothetical protein AVEN_218502-1 [Araneus ventricosus]|uniref:Reverse transcriptase domain-containing protein n=1 Tax=Araneus ventricosus TaxID=182803 RepID=A0A4Y2I7Z6_ARAVE|nr:hypothetical protein AVEN_218502-1 [Araneus ventricosus]
MGSGQVNVETILRNHHNRRLVAGMCPECTVGHLIPCAEGRCRVGIIYSGALKDFYVDDVLSGADNVSSALKLQQELVSLLKAGEMELHKWCANNEILFENVPTEDQSYQFSDSDKDTVKTLGLRRNPKEDCFNFTIRPSASVPTKRTVLADIAKLFDPLGFLGPVIVKAKVFLQKLCLQKI